MKLKLAVFITTFLSYLLIPFALIRRKKRAVLHISYMVHIAYFTVKILRENGIEADYLAIDRPGKYPADYTFPKSYGHLSAKERFREFFFFWKVVAKYPIIHSHFMMTLTDTAWEMKFFRLMGGKWVVHGRGCAERERDLNIRLHPQMNICEICDYNARICSDNVNVSRRKLTRQYADHVFVTTPDMKDFNPAAEHLPFFTPPIELPKDLEIPHDVFTIIHVTNHPGIEGTALIQSAIENLKKKGYQINFLFLRNKSNEEVLEAYRSADLSIGKMKMGYYANAQIESLYYGVPAVTYVRKEFLTPELENSGLIISDLKNLEQTIQYYMDHPEALAAKRKIAHESILKLHNNRQIALRYKKVYDKLLG